MVQIIQRGPSLGALSGQILGKSLGEGLGNFTGDYYANKSLQSVLANPELKNAPQSERLQALQSALGGYGERGQRLLQQQFQLEQQAQQEKTQKNESRLVQKLLKGEELTDQELENARPELQIAAFKARQPKAAPGGLAGQAVPNDVVNKIEEINKKYPNATSGERKALYDKAGIYPAASQPYVEIKQKEEELAVKKESKTQSDLSKEVGPLKQKIIERGNAARESIANKENLMDLVNRGNLTDPTVAAFLDNLPFNMGKRFLSDDTIEYKGGLVDNFRDLKTIFNGPARVKEIEIMENKIPDIYLTDSQKKQLLKSRIDISKIDLAREEAAAEIEEKMPNISALQFNREVEKKTQQKMDLIGKYVLGEQKAIIDAAERKKQLPLNLNDPDDKEIIGQIMREAKGDVKEAEKIAKQKGYRW